MKILSLFVAAFGLACLGLSGVAADHSTLLLAAVGLVCAFTTYRSLKISSFLKIFIAIFSSELILFGTAVLMSDLGWWPPSLTEYTLPESLPLTVGVFSILVYAVSHVPVIRAMTRIADRFFETDQTTVAHIGPLPAFRTTEHSLARAMVTFLVLINQAEVAINVRLNFFNRDWFNAIQAKDAKTFWSLLFTVFLVWAAIYIVSSVLEFVVQSTLIIRWRRWLTGYYVSRWLDGATHYRMGLRGGNFDNPDQRIAEDVNRFLDGGNVGYGIYSYSILLISTLSSLVSFAIILFNLSADFTIPGTDIAVPGFLFWVALVYAGIGTVVTHLIGRPLTRLFFAQQRYEADFRFSLVRLREYGEQVALLAGEPIEQRAAMGRFGRIFANYMAIINRRKQLLAFTASYGQISPFIPYIVAAPFYFAGKIQLGIMSQTAGAFSRVNEALTFFVTYYTSLADFKAVLDRLTTFDEAIESARVLGTVPPNIEQIPSHGTAIELADLTLSLPDGRVIVADSDVVFDAHQPALIVGPSGSGKSTLLRAISGIWPYGRGRVSVPAGARVMLVPQKPYLPIASLRAAVAYPAEPDTYTDSALRQALVAAQLPDFADRLDEEDNWGQRLSGGEQQRLAIARALLAKPDWLFLDEATAAIDEASEAALYRTLAEQMPQTTIVSIGHRSTLAAFHKRRVELRPNAEGISMAAEVEAKAAAE
jgi:putative ATP-binding cassette transporter